MENMVFEARCDLPGIPQLRASPKGGIDGEVMLSFLQTAA